VLLEPTTVVTKAWEQVVTVGQRAFWEPRTVLVTGAGPIGVLAALSPASTDSTSTSSTGSNRSPSRSSCVR
jgi:threonine dehydrogenase-like Zn-dependent dehydrogenase